jgi:hypothetical protein
MALRSGDPRSRHHGKNEREALLAAKEHKDSIDKNLWIYWRINFCRPRGEPIKPSATSQSSFFCDRCVLLRLNYSFSGRLFTTDFTDFTDEEPAVAYPRHPHYYSSKLVILEKSCQGNDCQEWAADARKIIPDNHSPSGLSFPSN